MRKPIIIDTDPGVDDSVALLLAFGDPDKFDIKLITTTSGNVPVSVCTQNVLYLCDNFKPYNIDVAEGEDVYKNIEAREVHGKHGLGNVVIGETKQKKLDTPAVDAIYKVLMESKTKVILAEFGPITNYAKLLKEHPDCKDKIDFIFFMGASTNGEGNVTPYAEFNVYKNPEALLDVLKSGVKITFCPKHLGDDCIFKLTDFTEHVCERKKDEFLRDLFLGANEPWHPGCFCVYDAQVMLGLLYPELYDFKKCDITVCLEGEKRGQTFITLNENGKYTVQLAKDIELIKKIIYEELYL